jgi:hypothetical protein
MSEPSQADIDLVKGLIAEAMFRPSLLTFWKDPGKLARAVKQSDLPRVLAGLPPKNDEYPTWAAWVAAVRRYQYGEE